MAVVAHHPVVIHFEGIAVGFFAVDEYLTVLYLQFIAFVNADSSFIN